MSRSSQKSSGPKRIRHGIKLRGKDAPAADHFVAQKWIALLESTCGADALREGLDYARQGQVVTLEITPGEVVANVQGRASRPYHTTLALRALDEKAWTRAIGAMADEAVYAAKLLAREFPSGIESVFDALDLPLVPKRSDVLHTTCTCTAADPCTHAAAVGYLTAERLAAEPMLLFALRGMNAEQVLERLRQVRTLHTHGIAAADPDPHIPGSQQEAPPLESQLDSYWRLGRDLHSITDQPPSSHVPHALLRRLGPSPLKGRFPMVGLLASIYDAVAAEARRLRDELPAETESDADAPATESGTDAQQGDAA